VNRKLAVELETGLKEEHKIQCDKCKNDKFYVFDDDVKGATDVVCVKCGELRMNWL
jgi:ribosomal protein S27E